MATRCSAMHAARRHLTATVTPPAMLRRSSAHVLKVAPMTACRSIASTSACALPRQLPRRRPVVETVVSPFSASEQEELHETVDDADEVASHTTAAPTTRLDGKSDDIPWYLREQEQYEEEEDASGEARVTTTKAVDLSVLAPDVELPDVLQGLHELLTQGPPSALVARPDDGVLHSDTNRRPLVYIHARARDPVSWCDWIVVVQIRSSAGSAVSRMAKEIGAYLSDKRPPMDEAAREQAEQEEARLRAEQQRRSHNHNANTTHWRPFKILTREAQDGMRLLHASDPERWSRKELAKTFRMSVESVRRILHSKWQPSAQVVQRQNRRANERRAERSAQFSKEGWHGREEEEIAQIRASLAQSNATATPEGDAASETSTNYPDDDLEEYRVVDDEGNVVDTTKRHKQRITYEGLVGVSADGKSHNSVNSSRGAKNAVGRGDGEWCLIDAGWCVVHVMTAKARNTYDVESQWDANAVRDVDEQSLRNEREQRAAERQRQMKADRFQFAR